MSLGGRLWYLPARPLPVLSLAASLPARVRQLSPYFIDLPLSSAIPPWRTVSTFNFLPNRDGQAPEPWRPSLKLCLAQISITTHFLKHIFKNFPWPSIPTEIKEMILQSNRFNPGRARSCPTSPKSYFL